MTQESPSKSRADTRPVRFRKRIRSEMHIGAVILVIILLAVSIAGLQTVAKFRKLTKNIRDRAHELPLSARLSNEISNLRVSFSHIDHDPSTDCGHVMPHKEGIDAAFWPMAFQNSLSNVDRALNDYEFQLSNDTGHDSHLTDNSLERASVARMRDDLSWIFRNVWGKYTDGLFREQLKEKLDQIQYEASLLPRHMKQRMDGFALAARADYHKWFRNVALLALFGVVAIIWLMRRFHKRIFQPLHRLVCGSRRVAAGDFDHRIEICSDDEIAELAAAMNLMTTKFQDINRDLNRQVQQRTREVVRTEQMASVGFLAAGVAHEINNPLASIAWSAESLESRIQEILGSVPWNSGDVPAEIEEMKKYLKRIQDEAFRCKGITSNLLNFARLGDARKVTTELAPLVEEVIEMVRPLSRYRDKNVELQCDRSVQAAVNAQEIKQVVLNLVTNALDSVDPGGHVLVRLQQNRQHARLVVTDNGCGMDTEVLRNIFEPFFTRRRDGQGTGLGLSITYRIIEEHGGSIHPESDGPGAGSTFTVTLPVVSDDKEQRTAA
jgi:signal transduction histidine kinase